MSLLSIVFLLVGVIVGFVVAQVFMKNKNSEDLKKSLEESLASALPKITQSAGEQTALLAKEKLESASVNLKQDFQNKQMIIQDTIKRLHDELKTANEKLERAEPREQSFLPFYFYIFQFYCYESFVYSISTCRSDCRFCCGAGFYEK